MISPRSTSAMATSWPLEATWTMPRKMVASRPRNKTAWPLASLAASAGLTASAGMSSSAVSIGRSTSARCPSPAAALWHKDSSGSSEIMSGFAERPDPARGAAPRHGRIRPAPGLDRAPASGHRCLCRIRPQTWHGRHRAFRRVPGGGFDTVAGGKFDGFAVARQVIGPLAVDLDRRKARRHLLDRAGEARQ